MASDDYDSHDASEPGIVTLYCMYLYPLYLYPNLNRAHANGTERFLYLYPMHYPN